MARISGYVAWTGRTIPFCCFVLVSSGHFGISFRLLVSTTVFFNARCHQTSVEPGSHKLSRDMHIPWSSSSRMRNHVLLTGAGSRRIRETRDDHDERVLVYLSTALLK